MQDSPNAIRQMLPITLTPATGATVNTVTTAAAAKIRGPAGIVAPIAIRGSGSPQLSIDGSVWASDVAVRNGDSIQARLTSSASTLTKNKATIYGLGRPIPWSVMTGYDADAVAFLTAASITDATITLAIHTLVEALKAASLWTSLKALWPFVGGTAGTHKWNLRTPTDSDGAFRLTFNGAAGWTHSATGANPAGTNTYADTFLQCDTHLSATAGGFGCYLRESGHIGNMSAMGADDNDAFGKFTGINPAYNASTGYGQYGDGQFNFSGNTGNSSAGFFFVGRDATKTKFYKGATALGERTHTPTLPAKKLYLGARNGNGITRDVTANEFALAVVTAEAWSDAKQTALNTAVVNFQTALSRNV